MGGVPGHQKPAAESVIRGKTIVKDDKKQASTKKMTPQSKVKKYNATTNKSKTKPEESSACISVSRDVVDGIMELGEQLKEANARVANLKSHLRGVKDQHKEELAELRKKLDHIDRHNEGLKEKLKHEREHRFDYKEYKQVHDQLRDARSDNEMLRDANMDLTARLQHRPI